MTVACTMSETLKWLASLPILMWKHSDGDSVELPSPLLHPGISVPVFITKVAQEVKLI